MEKFKAVEKAMKTKAFSKEGLSAAAKLDPKERARMEACDFLGNMVDELERQIETLEAEGESIQATMKKGKSNTSKAERVAEIERITERHKWHQGKLELIKRSLENSAIETEQVTDLEESIKYYVSDGMNDDFMEDDEMYDDLNLQEEEDVYGMNVDIDRVSSQDTQSVQEDAPELEPRIPLGKSKSAPTSDPPGASARRPSTHTKSPLPALATLHSTTLHGANGITATNMKPAPQPTRAPGETLKYASAAAAAAASEKNNLGIAPLPPPPDTPGTTYSNISQSALPTQGSGKTKASPIPLPSQPVSIASRSHAYSATSHDGLPSVHRSPAPQAATLASVASTSQSIPGIDKTDQSNPREGSRRSTPQNAPAQTASQSTKTTSASTSDQSGKQAVVQASVKPNGTSRTKSLDVADDTESIYHLPSGLQDLLQSFEATQKRTSNTSSQSVQRMLASSLSTAPDACDTAGPRNYRPEVRYNTPGYYPQDLDAVFDDPKLYSRIDPDTLFYVFYYRQGSYQQYLAAKALKDQSWRFHKQYQTWFQRHEEPKTITEEFEQGTYRFFDYESTW